MALIPCVAILASQSVQASYMASAVVPREAKWGSENASADVASQNGAPSWLLLIAFKRRPELAWALALPRGKPKCATWWQAKMCNMVSADAASQNGRPSISQLPLMQQAIMTWSVRVMIWFAKMWLLFDFCHRCDKQKWSLEPRC